MTPSGVSTSRLTTAGLFEDAKFYRSPSETFGCVVLVLVTQIIFFILLFIFNYIIFNIIPSTH